MLKNVGALGAFLQRCDEQRRSLTREPVLVSEPLVPLSFCSFRPNNIHFLDAKTLATPVGNLLLFFDIESGVSSWVTGHDDGGIGAIAVHPRELLYASCENGSTPTVYIHSWPSREVVQTLKGGAVTEFTAAAFSADGTRLATVSGEPDLAVTVWAWREGTVALRARSFNVAYKVAFSPFDDGALVTSGLGHIKFWRIARTFTGWKLHGSPGRFGRADISSVYGFAALPGGKVVSGTEHGVLLLWDDEFVQAEVRREDGAPCHIGGTNVVVHSAAAPEYVMSGGADGYLRWWEMAALLRLDLNTDATGATGATFCTLEPVHEVFVGDGVAVVGYDGGAGGSVALQDRGGAILVSRALSSADIVAKVVPAVRTVHTAPAGVVRAVAASPAEPLFLTGNDDRVVRAFCSVTGRVVAERLFAAAATVIAAVPLEAARAGRCFAVGFADGTVRVLEVAAQRLRLLSAARAHATAVVGVTFDRFGRRAATAAADGSVFVFAVDTIAAPCIGGISAYPAAAYSASFASIERTVALVPIGHVEVPVSPAWATDAADDRDGAHAGLAGADDHSRDRVTTVAFDTTILPPRLNGTADALLVGTARGTIVRIELPPLGGNASGGVRTVGAASPLLPLAGAASMLDTLAPGSPRNAGAGGAFFALRVPSDAVTFLRYAPAPPLPEWEPAADDDDDGPGGPGGAEAATGIAAAVAAAVRDARARAGVVAFVPVDRPIVADEADPADAAVRLAGLAGHAAAAGVYDSGSDDDRADAVGAALVPDTSRCAADLWDRRIVALAKPGGAFAYELRTWAGDVAPALPRDGDGAAAAAAAILDSAVPLAVGAPAAATAAVVPRVGAPVGAAAATEPPAVALLPPNATPSCCAISADRRTLLIGTTAGAVHARNLTVDVLDALVSAPVHQRNAKVVAVALTVDGTLISAAEDGALVAQRFAPEAADVFAAQTWPVDGATVRGPAATGSAADAYERDMQASWGAPAADAEDLASECLPIEAARAEAERARAEALAAASRAGLEERVAVLLARHDALLARNAALSDAVRLPPSVTDPLPSLSARLTERVLAVARREKVEWRRQNAALRETVGALMKAYVEPVELERSVVNGLRAKVSVATLRTARLTDRQVACIDLVRSVLSAAAEDDRAGGRDAAAAAPNVSTAAGAAALMSAFLEELPGGARDSPRGRPSSDRGAVRSFSGVPNGSFAEDASIRVGSRASHAAGGGSAAVSPSPDHPLSSRALVALDADADAVVPTDGVDPSGATAAPRRGAAATTAVERAEQRRLERRECELALAAALARMPDPDADDPEDADAVERARSAMGELRLKSDPTHAPSEEDRATAERKLRQLALLDDAVHTLALDFNERFFALKAVKRHLVVEAATLNAAIATERSIYDALGGTKEALAAAVATLAEDVKPGEPRLEIPLDGVTLAADRDDYDSDALFAPTDAELAEHERTTAKDDRRRAKEAAAARGWSAALAGANNSSDDDDDDDANRTASGAANGPRVDARSEAPTRVSGPPGARSEMNGIGPAVARRAGGRVVDWHRRAEVQLRERITRVPRTATERAEAAIHAQHLAGSIARSLRRVARLVSAFDRAVGDLASERLRLACDLKRAELKRLLLLKELLVLREYREKERELADALRAKVAEHAAVLEEIHNCQNVLRERQDQIQGILAREKTLAALFQALVGEAGPHHAEYLTKLYRRRVRADAGSDADGSSDGGSDAGGDVDDPCPASLSAAIFDRALALRSERLDHEDSIGEFTRALETLKRSNDAFAKRESAVEADVARLRGELASYRNATQRRVLSLHGLLTLRFHQVQCLEPTATVAPRSLAHVVAFTNEGVAALSRRVDELVSERGALEEHFADLKRSHGQLARRRAEQQQLLHDAEQRVEEVQLLKFGQRVNLDLLEGIALDRETVALREQLRAVEARGDVEVKEWDGIIDAAKEELALATAENSRHLHQLAVLKAEQQHLEQRLDAAHGKVLGRLLQTSTVATTRDRVQLEDLVFAQQHEVDNLTAEIGMLRSKGGYKYASSLLGNPAPPAGSAGEQGEVLALPAPPEQPVQRVPSAPTPGVTGSRTLRGLPARSAVASR